MFDFLSEKFSSVFARLTGNSRLTESTLADAIERVRQALLEADVPYEVVQAFIQQIQQETIGKKVVQAVKPADYFIKIVYDTLCTFLGDTDYDHTMPFKKTGTIMVVGLQGAGKTSSIAKIIVYLKNLPAYQKKRFLVASVDYYRPAAREQLSILAQSVGIDCYRAQETNPIKAAQEIVAYSSASGYDYLFLDTAGRLHVDTTMMEELKTLNTVVNPTYCLLVLDAMTGQESLRVATAFDQAISFAGVLLTKMDSDTRAGAAFGFKYQLRKPILWIATGEKPSDLEPFVPERIAQRMLGMGDLQTLLERANAALIKEEQEALAHRMMSGNFTLEDFAQQLRMVQKLGSLTKVAQYIPGLMNGARISPLQVEQSEREFKKFRAILDSMTVKERKNPQVLNGSRKKRIAQGAGVAGSDIDLLMQRFEQSRQFVKLIKKFGYF